MESKDMESEECDGNLPDDLVERIIAMMPFPQILKARRLSRTWLARFSPESWQDDEDMRGVVTRFHKLVAEWSRNWKIYWPCKVSLARLCNNSRLDDVDMRSLVRRVTRFQTLFEEWSRNWTAPFHESLEWELLAHDCGHGTLQKNLLSLSFLCPAFGVHFQGVRSKLHMEGALILLLCLSSPLPTAFEDEMYVANVLTRSYKRLPPRPRPSGEFVFWTKLLNHRSLPFYEVFVMSRPVAQVYERGQQPNEHECYLQIYNSESQLWSTKLVHSEIMGIYKRQPVYMNGILYILDTFNRILMVSDFQEGKLELLDVGEHLGTLRLAAQLVVCDVGLMMIVWEDNYARFRVLKIDLGSGKVIEVAWGPPGTPYFRAESFGHGDCIYFGVDTTKPSSPKYLTYNVLQNEWSLLPYPWRGDRYYDGLLFQPGLNPFMEV